MRLIKLYKEMLKIAGMSADKDGFVSGSLGTSSKEAPVTIKGKRLVLPTKHQLANPEWSDRIVFHPLYENVLRGESQVIEKLRNLICVRLNYTIGVIGTALLTLAASNARHSELKPDQSEFLACVRMLDEKAVTTFQKILENMNLSDIKNGFVSMYLKRSGVVGGKKFSRVGVVSFPFYQAITSETFAGVKLRNKDREVLTNLMQYIFHNIAVENAYNCGSDSSVAPYTDALLRTSISIFAAINDVVNLFKDIIPELADLEFNCDWVEMLDSLDSYAGDIRAIPMQAGNEGQALIKPVTVEAPMAAPVVATTAVVQKPTYEAPVPTNHVYANPQYGVLANHPIQHHQPVYQNQYHQVPAGPVVTKDGLDFASVIASRPGLAGVSYSGGNMMNQQQQIQNQTPRWATPQMNYGNVGYNNQQFNNFGGGGVGQMPLVI